MKHLENSLILKKSLWLYVGVVFLAFVAANTIGAIPLVMVVVVKALTAAKSGGHIGGFTSGGSTIDFAAMGIPQNAGLLLMLIPFVVGLFALIYLIKYLNKKTWQETINGTQKVRWSRVWWGAGVWLVIIASWTAISYFISPDNFIFQFDLASFIPLLLISLLLIPLQTTFEEMSFRGYLAQGIAGSTGSRWLAFIIPSVAFGLLHSMNPEVKEFGFLLMMPQYIFFGLIFGLMSTLDDGIELAIGAHAANNTFLSLFITSGSSVFQTPAVFMHIKPDPEMELISFLISGVLMTAFFYKKYNWKFSTLNKRVVATDDEIGTIDQNQ